MNSRSAALAIFCPLMRKLPRRSSASQPYTAGTSGHFAIPRRTGSSIVAPLELERVDCLRCVDAEALGVGDAEGLEPLEDFGLLDALGDDAETDRRAHALHRGELRARDLAREQLARDRAVDLHEGGTQRLERREAHRTASEAVDDHAA